MQKIENHMVVNIREVEKTCGECSGRGKVLEMDGDGYESWVDCGNCEGTGKRIVKK